MKEKIGVVNCERMDPVLRAVTSAAPTRVGGPAGGVCPGAG